ncbi:MAG: hypothetical protein IJN64_18510 [Lachnospiraceae bacterium]|nr:hypothetical protein [Lachnospiraceae bacterium]
MQKVIQRKRIESLYVLKTICAFFVVSIHLPQYECLLRAFAGVGTPIFLSITGYLLYSYGDTARELKKCTSWARKSFFLALTFNIIYGVFLYLMFDENILTSGVRIIKSLVLGTGIVPYLWYLTALWEALLLLWLIIKYVPRLIYFLPLFYILAYILRSYEDGVFFTYANFDFYSTTFRNTFIVTSIPFLATGYLIHKYHEKILKLINVNFWLVVAILFATLEYYIRIDMFGKCSYFMLSTWPLIVLLMLICIKYQDFTLPILGNIGRNHSPNIYYFHGLFIWVINTYHLEDYNFFVLALGVYAACLPCSYVYNYISKKWFSYVWEPFVKRKTLLYRKV